MSSIRLSIDAMTGFVSKEEVYALESEAAACQKALHDKSGKGNDFLGWVNLPLIHHRRRTLQNRRSRFLYKEECGNPGRYRDRRFLSGCTCRHRSAGQ